ncbi:MAG TPA: hypothetical protein VF189_05115 [Patescibacteria group bacterium]
MTLISIFAFLSTALAIYCTIPYIHSILNGKTKPHQLTWLVFSIMNGIVFFSQLLAGGRASVIISFVFLIGSLLVFLLSLKFGLKDSSKWDRVLFIFALLTIAIWFVTRNNALAIWLTVIIDIAATTMTILKINSQPNSEDPYPWIVASVAYVFTCLTLWGQPLSVLYIRPLYGLIGDVILVAFIYYSRKRKEGKSQFSPLEA